MTHRIRGGRATTMRGRSFLVVFESVLAASLFAQACKEQTTSMRADAGALSEAGAHAKAATTPVLRWVGVVRETDARVAAVVGRGKARLFFCGGADSYATSTRWFDIDFNSEHLEYDDGNWHIHAHLLQGVTGEVQHAGDDERSFNAGPFPPATLSGLYEGKAACGRIGLIVTQPSEHELPTAQGACTGDEGKPVQQVSLVGSLELGTRQIRVQTMGGEIVLLQPAALDPL